MNIPVRLHKSSCICKGTGWLCYPGIGPHAECCPASDVIVISYQEWIRTDRLKTVEQYTMRMKEKTNIQDGDNRE